MLNLSKPDPSPLTASLFFGNVILILLLQKQRLQINYKETTHKET